MKKLEKPSQSSKFLIGLTSLLSVFILLQFSGVSAQYTSPSYKAEETQFGIGGDPQVTSPSYKAQASVGSLGVGRFASSSYQAYSGFLTPNEPFLEMIVTTTSVNLGVLDTAVTRTGSAVFQVRAYTDSGYTVVTASPTLTSVNGDTIDGMAQGAPLTNHEQFGINLRANSSPINFGADASPQPDSSFANGQAATGYDQTNQFKYSQGDTIAQTNTSGWGLTIYTIAYIANINVITPAGNYSMVHDLVAIPTY